MFGSSEFEVSSPMSFAFSFSLSWVLLRRSLILIIETDGDEIPRDDLFLSLSPFHFMNRENEKKTFILNFSQLSLRAEKTVIAKSIHIKLPLKCTTFRAKRALK